MRTGRSALAVFAVMLLSPAVHAAPTFLASPPEVDRAAGEMVMLVGGISEEGSTLKPNSVEVEIDGVGYLRNTVRKEERG